LNIIPLEDKVVVRPIKDDEVTSSGLVLAKIGEEKPSEGIVEAVGPGIVFPNGTKLNMDLKVGDKVVYSKYGGTEYKDVILLPYKDILVVLGE
jgi:chaperonin GroES